MLQNGNPGHVLVDPEEQQRVLLAASCRPAMAVIQAAADKDSPPRQRQKQGHGQGEGPSMSMSVSDDDEFARREKSWRRTKKGTVEARGEERYAASGGVAPPSVPSRDRRRATATATTENVNPPRVVSSSSCSSSSPPPRSITPHPTSFSDPPPLSPPPSQRTGGGGVVVPPRGDPRRSHLATRSLSDPIMSSRLRLDPSARLVPARGFTKAAWDLARDGQLLPHVPIPCRVPIAAYHHHHHHHHGGEGGGSGAANHSPASRPYRPIPFLLSRRYARSASDSFLSSRSPVQERSVPRFSSSSASFSSSSSSHSAPARKRQRASLGGSSSASTATHGSQSGTISATAAAVPYDHRLLFEYLVLVTLERRLADRLARARAAESPPPPSSDKSASSSPEGGGRNRAAAVAAVERAAGMGGGIRPGREMWIWSAVRRTRTRESRAAGGGGRGVAAAQSVFNPISIEASERSRLSAADTMRQTAMTRSSHARSTSLPVTLPQSSDSATPQPPLHRLSSSSSSPGVQIFTRHPFLPLRLRLPSRPIAAHMRPLSDLGTDEPGTVVARPVLDSGDLAMTGDSGFAVSKKGRGEWVLEERRRWGCRMPKRPERVAVAV